MELTKLPISTPPFDLSSVLLHAAEEGWTQSEITTMDNCGMLWFWRYGLLLRKKVGINFHTLFGSGFHTALEEMYTTGGKRWSIPDLRSMLPKGTSLADWQQRDLAYWQGVLRVQTECYSIKYRDDFDVFKPEKVELIIDITFYWQGKPIRLKGMIDLTFYNVANEGYWMLDHKTSTRLTLSTVLGWDFRFQFMFYLWLLAKYEEQQGVTVRQKFQGYYINAIKKPTIKVRKNDSLDIFLERLRNEMLMEPEKYYYRQTLLMNKGALDKFEQKVLGPKLHRIQLLTNPEIPDSIKLSIVNNMNTDYCQKYQGYPCEFIPLCQHGFKVEGFQFEKREVKHTELSSDEVDE